MKLNPDFTLPIRAALNRRCNFNLLRAHGLFSERRVEFQLFRDQINSLRSTANTLERSVFESQQEAR